MSTTDEHISEPSTEKSEHDNKDEVRIYAEAASIASELGLGINAGHDLSLDNLEFFVKEVPDVLEVSIGHALISESLYFGLENVVGMYLQKLSK